jgi:hypothetical protein
MCSPSTSCSRQARALRHGLVLAIAANLFFSAPRPAQAELGPPLELAQLPPPPTEVRRAIDDAFVSLSPLLGGYAWIPRPAAEVPGRLATVATRFPDEPAVLVALALAAERAGDFALAERTWLNAVPLARGDVAVRWLVADYHARRNDADAELLALGELERALVPPGASAEAASARAALEIAHHRAIATIDAHALAGARADERWRHRRALVDLAPDDGARLAELVSEHLAAKDLAGARAEVDRYAAQHPGAPRHALRQHARVDLHAGRPDAALSRYRRALAKDPFGISEGPILADYVELLTGLGRETAEREALEARVLSPSGTIADVVLLCQLYQAAGQPERARDLLRRGSGPAKTPAERIIVARLAARVGDLETAIQHYHGVAATAPQAPALTALIELTRLLLGDDAPAGALTPLPILDVFAPDRFATGPSLPGGLLSYVFEPYRFSLLGQGLHRLGVAWQNGARADGLYQLGVSRFGESPALRELGVTLILYHEKWARPQVVVELGERWLKRPGRDPRTPRVHSAIARARRALGDTAGSDRAYQAAVHAAAGASGDAEREVVAEWVQTLADEGRATDAIAILWAHLERSPGDVRRWQALTDFVVATGVFDEERKVYERALRLMPGADPAIRLGRWQLRHRGATAYRAHLDRVVAALPLGALEQTLAELAPLDFDAMTKKDGEALRALYREALERFPHHRAFVYALLAVARQTKATAEENELIVRYGVVDPALRARLIEGLAADGGGKALDRLAQARNPGERLIRAELLVWLSRHEDALADALAVRAAWPFDQALTDTAVALTLATAASPGDAPSTRAAVELCDAMHARAPAEPRWLDRAASILAEAGDEPGARARWAALIAARPGDPATRLAVAAAQWDYHLFADAMTTLAKARALTGDPMMYWDRAAAIAQAQKRLDAAAEEIIAALGDDVDRELAAARPSAVAFDFAHDDGDGGDGGAWGYRGDDSGDGSDGDDGDDGDDGGRDDDGDGGNVEATPRHGAETTPSAALAALERIPGGRAAVDRVFVVLRKRRPGDATVVLTHARFLGERGDATAYERLVGPAVARSKAPDVLAVVAAEARARGLSRLHLAALERRAQIGGRSAALLWPIADAYEAAGQPDAAASTAEAAVQATAKGKKAPDAHVNLAWVRLAELHERLGHGPLALEAYARSLDWVADGEARVDQTLALATRLASAGDRAGAQARYREVLGRRPLELRAVDGLAALATTSGDDAAVATIFTAGLGAIDGASLPTAQAKLARRALRLAWIARLEQRGQGASVMDQWIHVVEAEPDDQDLVRQAVAMGLRAGRLDRFERHFAAAAERSFKDVRWPLILAWIAEATARPAEAASRYGAALAVRPDRLELRAAKAKAHAAAGDHAAALAEYRELHHLSDEDETWLLAVAGEALVLEQATLAAISIATWLEASVWRGPSRFDDAAMLYEARHAWAPAVALRRRALVEALDHLGRGVGELDERDLAALCRAALRAGQAKVVVAELERARAVVAPLAETTDAAQASLAALDHALGEGLLEVIAADAVDEDAEALWPTIVATARSRGPDAIAELGDAADRAGLVRLALPLLDEARKQPGLDEWTQDRRAARLIMVFTRRGADRALLAYARVDASLHTAEILPELAEAARRLGDEATELELLLELWQKLGRAPGGRGPTWRHPLVERTLELLVRRPDGAARLGAFALATDVGAGQIIEWLWRNGRGPLAEAALAAFAKREDAPPRFVVAQTAQALSELSPDDARIDGLFLRALGHRTIGETLADPTHGDAEQPEAYLSERRAALALVFARRVAARRPKAIALADWAGERAELAPARADGHVAAGRVWLAAGDPARARQHFELGLGLEPGHAAARDGLARAKLAQGDRAGALATWQVILDAEPASAVQFGARAMADAGLVLEARAALTRVLTTRFARLDEAGGAGLVTTLAELTPANERGPGGPLDRTLIALVGADDRPWPHEAVLGVSLRSFYGWGDAAGLDWSLPGRASGPGATLFLDALVEQSALEPYLDAAVAQSERAKQPWRTAHLERARLALLVAERRFDRASALLAAAEARARTQGQEAAWIVFAQVDLDLARGRAAAAEARALGRLTSRPDPAEEAALNARFVAARERQAAARLRVAFLTRMAPTLELDLDAALALADAHLVLGAVANAETVLTTALGARPGDADARLAAAKVYADHAMWRAALPLTLDARTLAPHRADVRLTIARTFAALGQARPAIEVAALILGDRDASRGEREAAARLVGEQARLDAGVARAAAAATKTRAARSPFDEATFAALAETLALAGDLPGARTAAETGVSRGVGVGLALVARGRFELAAGRAAAAAQAFDEAQTGAPGRDLPLLLFAARHALAEHAAAIGALAPIGLADWREARPGPGLASSRALALGCGRAALPGERGTARAFLAAAAKSAEAIGDRSAQAFFLTLAAELEGGAAARRTLADAAVRAQADADAEVAAAAARAERRLIDLTEVR